MHDYRTDASRPDFDELIHQIADYVLDDKVTLSDLAFETAQYCWMDTIGCGLYALEFPACTNLLGPIVPGAELKNGARVPGTSWELDPVRAAWNIGAAIRWLDYNDTWLAAEWGHPSDNLGAIQALADYLDRQENERNFTMQDILRAMIKAHEIQGVLALENAFNRVGLDHVMLVRIASAAVTAGMLGCDHQQVMNAVSNAWIDGCALRTYRHAPNTGSRKSWAAGDATSRGLFLAMMSAKGEMGYPSALSAEGWGFQDVLFRKQDVVLSRDFGSYVMENVLFKISFPAEFHAQTAVEAAIQLHPQVSARWEEIDRIEIRTQEAAMRIINKTGVLNNPADRDHCLQYMVAVALLFGRLTAADYEDTVASDSRIDQLRDKTECVENARFSREYLEADKRAIGNAIQVFFQDGSETELMSIDYPIGHRRRRDEGIPRLCDKFERYAHARLLPEAATKLLALCMDRETFEATRVRDVAEMLTV